MRPKLCAGRGVALHGKEVVVKIGVIAIRIATPGDEHPAGAIEKESVGAMVLADSIIKLPEQLSVAPA
jgi:hypothetical protein